MERVAASAELGRELGRELVLNAADRRISSHNKRLAFG